MKLSVFTRKTHRWGAVITAIPVLVIVGSGLFLQLKKDVAWIQPATKSGSGSNPKITFDRVLEIAMGVPEAEIAGWDDIDRLDVRPGNGMLKVRCKNRREIQLDADTGEILQVAYRRSDLIEDIHDGSFFHDKVKLWVFLASGIMLFGLWCTGIYLFLLPYTVKRRKRKKVQRECYDAPVRT